MDYKPQEKKEADRPQGLFMPWMICILAALFYSYDFLLRVLPSIMIHPLMAEFGVNATSIGLLSAFYYYAYTPLQLPSGVVADKYSPRWVLSLSALCCAVGALIFSMTHHLFLAYVSRIMMGIGSAFAFVGALKLASMWLPKKQFALFTGIATAMGTLGAMVTDTALSHMVTYLGWRQTVFVSAIFGFILSFLLWVLIRDNKTIKPSKNKKNYYDWINILWRLWGLFKSLRFWVNGLVATGLFLPISVFASLWGVDFIAERFDIPAAKAASLTSLIFLGMAVSGPFMGWFSDKIRSRKILLIFGGVMVLALSFALIYLEDFPFILIFPTLFFIGFFVGPQVLSFAVAKEISPSGSTGLSTAVTNFIVTIGAAILQPLIGYLLQSTWDGTKTVMGTPHYTVVHYREAFFILMACLAISIVLSLFLPVMRRKS